MAGRYLFRVGGFVTAAHLSWLVEGDLQKTCERRDKMAAGGITLRGSERDLFRAEYANEFFQS
jgi:hypothetical protein